MRFEEAEAWAMLLRSDSPVQPVCAFRLPGIREISAETPRPCRCLLAKGFRLDEARLSFSSRRHGASLQTLLRSAGRAHLIVCEGSKAEVFGVSLGFRLRRFSSKAYGSCRELLLFDLGLPGSTARVFTSDATGSPVRSLEDALVVGIDGDTALSLNWDLTEALCQPTVLCEGASLSQTTQLKSLTVFSLPEPGAPADAGDRRVSYLTAAWGTDPEVERNVARQLLEFSDRQSLRDHFG